MINLLPPEAKKEILMERKRRIVLLNWFFILLLLVLIVLSTYAVYFYLQDRLDSLKALLEKSNFSSESSANEEMLEKISLFNLSFQKINDYYNRKVYISGVLEKLSLVLPQSVYLKEISFSSDLDSSENLKESKGFNVYVSGFSPTRDDLLLLESNMKKESAFKAFDFPLTNLVKEANIDFYLTFKVYEPEK